MLFALLAACGAPVPKDTPADAADDTAGDTAADTAGPTDPGAWIDVETVSVTLSFDVTATEAGAPADCTYVRQFEGVDLGDLADVVCPDCRDAFIGYTRLEESSRACYEAWNPIDAYAPADRMEAVGWSRSGFSRSYVWPLGSVIAPDGWTVPAEDTTSTFSYETFITGTYTADLTATVTVERGGVLSRPDPAAERETPYTCGWPQLDPGDVEASTTVAIGSVVPADVMEDQCGEAFDLRDLYGRWVLFQSVWSDCDACVHTALAANAVAAGRDDLTVVTLYFGDDAGWEEAKRTYGDIGPVLRDLGYGSVVPGVLMYSTTAPSRWWLVDPAQVLVTAGWGTDDFSELAEWM